MTTPPPPSPEVPQDCGTIINITSSSDPEVFPEDIARTCFRCQFGSPPTSDPMTTWMLNGSVISPSQGVVVDGVLVVFDPVEAIGISAPVPIVCVSSAAENLTISAQALGKLHALSNIYMQQLISFMCEWRGFTCGLSLCMRGFEKLESLLMQTADSCFGLFGPRQCSCSTWSLPATPS